jgi:hypothetical protein
MLVLTDALKTPKIRIGHIGGNFTLPRTVPMASLVAGGVGAAVGLLLGFGFLGGTGPSVYSAVICGAVGVFFVTWSPLKGESLLKWLGLRVKRQRQNLSVDGEPVQLAVGIALVNEVILGAVRIRAGAVTVPASQYDERGVHLKVEQIFDRLLSEPSSYRGEVYQSPQELRWLDDYDYDDAPSSIRDISGEHRQASELARAQGPLVRAQVASPTRAFGQRVLARPLREVPKEGAEVVESWTRPDAAPETESTAVSSGWQRPGE